jgi:hypothetical protein
MFLSILCLPLDVKQFLSEATYISDDAHDYSATDSRIDKRQPPHYSTRSFWGYFNFVLVVD